MKGRLALGLALFGAIAAAIGADAALAHTSTAAVQTGVVVVRTNLAYENGAAAGTGMVLTSSGEVLTNNHVIRGATTIKVIVPQTKKTYAARVLGYDVTADVALLQIVNASGLATVNIGRERSLVCTERSRSATIAVARCSCATSSRRMRRCSRATPAGRC